MRWKFPQAATVLAVASLSSGDPERNFVHLSDSTGSWFTRFEMKRMLLPTLFCLLLTGCKIDLPSVESCFIGNAAPSGGLVDKTELSPAQLKPLSEWFAGLGGGWKFKVVDNFPSGVVLVLNHKRNRTTWVNLRGDQLWIGNRFRVLTPSERAGLLALVSEKNRLPIFGRQ